MLVSGGVLAPERLEEAVAAQLIYGGRLGTCLVDLGFVREEALTAFLGRQLGMTALGPAELAQCAPEALRVLSPSQAARLQAVPYKLAGRRLSVALADPTSLETLDALRFITGLHVEPHLAPESLLLSALERCYGVRRRRRHVALAEGTEPAPVALPGRDRPSIAECAKTLGEVRSGREVLERVVEFLGARFGRVAACVLQDGAYRPRVLRVPDASRAAVEALRIVPAHLPITRDDDSWPCPHTPVSLALAEALGAGRDACLLVLPVAPGAPPAAVVVGARPVDPWTGEDTVAVRACAEKARLACELVSLRRRIAVVPEA